jgi:hypothetical protein
MLFGFMLQFALGTAAWILPKKGGVKPVDRPALLFNVALAFVLVAQTVNADSWVEASGRGALLLATAWIVSTLWPRVQQILPVSHG